MHRTLEIGVIIVFAKYLYELYAVNKSCLFTRRVLLWTYDLCLNLDVIVPFVDYAGRKNIAAQVNLRCYFVWHRNNSQTHRPAPNKAL